MIERAWFCLHYRNLVYTKRVDSVEGALWLASQTPNMLSYLAPSNSGKMASRSASVTSEEIIQINDEAVPENTKKAIKFGLAVFKGNGLSLSIKSNEKGFVYKCKLILRNLTCSLENQSWMTIFTE